MEIEREQPQYIHRSIYIDLPTVVYATLDVSSQFNLVDWQLHQISAENKVKMKWMNLEPLLPVEFLVSIITFSL